jgi:hypothetical protein
MSQQLISRSPDLQRLRNEGYDIAISAGYLLLKDVPYVNAAKEVKRGILVSDLHLAGDRTAPPTGRHVAYWIGEHPCTNLGVAISAIKHGSNHQKLAEGLEVDHSFSNKPAADYPDYYEKMTRYVTIIEHYAQAIEPSAAAKTFPPIRATEPHSVFEYIDTASSRAGIAAVMQKLELRKIVIVGLGGSGSYVLDLVAKTPVREILLYDSDTFLQHNAFRAPGAPSIEELEQRQTKVARFAQIYSRMHRNIVPHDAVTEMNVDELRDADFVFICIDETKAKQLIIERLETFGVSFIDVGIGLDLTDGALGGILRTTTSTKAKHDHVEKRVPLNAAEDDEYATNIQIAELNALNAALAVIKWKKLCGFYRDLELEHDSTYTIDGNTIANEERS